MKLWHGGGEFRASIRSDIASEALQDDVTWNLQSHCMSENKFKRIQKTVKDSPPVSGPIREGKGGHGDYHQAPSRNKKNLWNSAQYQNRVKLSGLCRQTIEEWKLVAKFEFIIIREHLQRWVSFCTWALDFVLDIFFSISPSLKLCENCADSSATT